MQISDDVSIAPHNNPLAPRHLRLQFSYDTHSQIHVATLNMSNVGLWKGGGITTQVLKSDENQLVLTICEPENFKLYSLLMTKNTEVDPLTTSNDILITKTILKFRNIAIFSTSSLQANCTEEILKESSAKRANFTFGSILVLLLTGLFMS